MVNTLYDLPPGHGLNDYFVNLSIDRGAVREKELLKCHVLERVDVTTQRNTFTNPRW